MTLLTYCKESILPILRSQPAPKLGEWNWPQIVETLEGLIAEAEATGSGLQAPPRPAPATE